MKNPVRNHSVHSFAFGGGGRVALAVALVASAGCGGEEEPSDSPKLSGLFGPGGGVLRGRPGTTFGGFEILIPAGALTAEVPVTVTRVEEGSRPLPEGAKSCGPMFLVEPAGLALALPAEVTLPFDPAVVEGDLRFADEVKVWVDATGGWARERQIGSTATTVSIELGSLGVVAAGINPPKPSELVTFSFYPVAAFEACLARYPNDPNRRPTVEALVVPGEGVDTMFISGVHIKPGLGFDLFSIERSLLAADGRRDPAFRGFGLAWYQTDLQANQRGRMQQVIRTVLLDEAFGLDEDVQLAPTRTFHLGFWFTDPNAAAACGFDPSRPTPFNGEQAAGPLAMATVPSERTGVGPLCPSCR